MKKHSCGQVTVSLAPRVSRFRASRGFTLTEALVALAAGLAVLCAAFEGLRHFQQRLTVQQQRIAAMQDARLGLQVMEAELRLAGTGAAPTMPPLVKAMEDEVEFQANLSGLVTTLTAAANIGQVDLAVHSGTGWPKGKRVVLCAGDQCVEHRLARDGRSHGLTISTPLSQTFAAGSTVTVTNQVRYYLREDVKGDMGLMRMVDGGANTLIGGVGLFRMNYYDRQGRPSRDQRAVTRMKIEFGLKDLTWKTIREIGIKSP